MRPDLRHYAGGVQIIQAKQDAGTESELSGAHSVNAFSPSNVDIHHRSQVAAIDRYAERLAVPTMDGGGTTIQIQPLTPAGVTLGHRSTSWLSLINIEHWPLHIRVHFTGKWIGGESPDYYPLLGAGNIQALADLGNSCGIVEKMKLIPIDTRDLIHLIVASLLPMALLLLIMPLKDLLRLFLKVVTWRSQFSQPLAFMRIRSAGIAIMFATCLTLSERLTPRLYLGKKREVRC